MKALIGYGIFRKPDMVRWMESGIEEHFPPETKTLWYLEAPDEDMRVAMNSRPYEYREEHILEQGVHRHLIERFMETDCDVLIVPQDDNRFERPLIPDLEELWSKYGTNLGWISGRDGHDLGYANTVCSPFSDSNIEKTVIPVGDYREVRMMNTGPVVYFRHVIEKVGLPDPDMPWYWWSDYALRCGNAGLTNILLSMGCLHTKFGRIGNNPGLFDDALVARCLKTLNERWYPVFGRNVI